MTWGWCNLWSWPWKRVNVIVKIKIKNSCTFNFSRNFNGNWPWKSVNVIVKIILKKNSATIFHGLPSARGSSRVLTIVTSFLWSIRVQTIENLLSIVWFEAFRAGYLWSCLAVAHIIGLNKVSRFLFNPFTFIGYRNNFFFLPFKSLYFERYVTVPLVIFRVRATCTKTEVSARLDNALSDFSYDCKDTRDNKSGQQGYYVPW